ncbi:MAG: ferrochelatase [Deltaproteobacteria bacterium RIFCSPHIGHO2_02_FULL_44_16]|nr:MAG: ferrochelatase [Deltaproteobacteria bacterium RIFCSPHIGHO2_02_FULL_44_16]
MSRGVLLVNLGSPDSPSIADVRRYLHQFLMDSRVLDVPYLLRKFIVCCRVLPKRSKQTAHAYQQIWTEEGSPLLVISERVRRFVQKRAKFPVALGMRYGNPSIRGALKELLSDPELDEILLIPQYPHYAMASYETAVVEVQKELRSLQKKEARHVTLKIIPPFFERRDYLKAIVESIKPFLTKDFDHLLLTYHGVPLRHLRKTDPTGKYCLASEACCAPPQTTGGAVLFQVAHETCYRAQTKRTTEGLVDLLSLSPEKYSMAYQSRFGKDEWLTPFTEETIRSLAKRGVKKLLVLSPGFTVDCLETLEEIGMRGRDVFREAGGEELTLLPCLNDHPAWIETLAAWCK